MEEVLDAEMKAQFESVIPRREMGRPEEIASVALFLASDDSSYVNGTELVVDGGTTVISADPAITPTFIDSTEETFIMTTISIIGSGNMAAAIGTRAAKRGHTVELLSRNPANAQALADQIGNGATVGTFGARPAG